MQVTSAWQGNGPVFIRLCWEDGRKRPDAFVCGERSLGPSKTAQIWELLGSAWSPGRNSFCFIVSFKDRVLKSPKYIALENADTKINRHRGSNNRVYRHHETQLQGRGEPPSPQPAASHPVRMPGRNGFLFPRLPLNPFRNQGLNHSEIAWELRSEYIRILGPRR